MKPSDRLKRRAKILAQSERDLAVLRARYVESEELDAMFERVLEALEAAEARPE